MILIINCNIVSRVGKLRFFFIKDFYELDTNLKNTSIYIETSRITRFALKFTWNRAAELLLLYSIPKHPPGLSISSVKSFDSLTALSDASDQSR